MGQLFHDKGFIYISHKYKLIFIPIPKNGSTSIRKIAEFDFKQDNYFNYLDEINNNKYQLFSVIRNPIERIVSGYIETILRGYNNINNDYLWIKDPEKRFKQFIVELEEKIFDPHLWQQQYLITDYNNNYFKNVHLLNFDNYEESFYEYMKHLNLKNIFLKKEKVYNRKNSNLWISKIPHRFSKFILLKINSFKSNNNKVDYNRYIYLSLIALVSRLTYKRNLPDKYYVLSLIKKDQQLMDKIEEIYYKDFRIYDQINNTTGFLTTDDIT